MDTSVLTKPSLTLRIGIGKAVGFLIGLSGFVLLPLLAPDAGWMIRWGILLWYTTLGAIIGWLATRFGGEGPETAGH